MEKIQVHYEDGALEFARQLIGRHFLDEELAAAVGALDGSSLNVRIRKGAELAVEVKNEKILEQIRFIRRDESGSLSVWNFRFEKARGFYGVGLESLLRQIKGARGLEVSRIECYAAGNFADTRYSGYYRWACYGFDAPLTEDEKNVLWQSPQFNGVVCLNDLMLRDGVDWWKEHGTERKMIFVLDESSSMMATLRKYVSEKHPELIEELL